MTFSIISFLRRKHLIGLFIFFGLFFCLLAIGFTPMVFAQDPVGVSFTLEGCRDPSVDLELTNFVCADGDYTTGNLGKTWNELDLVPHRVTTSAGNSAPATQTYTIAVVADYSDIGNPGYDIISEPVINNTLSDSSCSVNVGPESHAIPGLGGIDDSAYRLLTITQDKKTTCVFDYFQRLAVGSHLFPGSSLHSNLANQSLGTAGIGSKEVSIPVKEILPQELEKDMTATQDMDYIWNITKGSTPASLEIENTCCPDIPLELEVKLLIHWEVIPTSANTVTVVTNIYAVNPAHRTITVNVTDEIFGTLGVAEKSLDIKHSGDVDIPPNTSQLVCTHLYEAPPHVTGLHDVATATYIDKVTGIPVPGQTTATASATIQPGDQTNTTATITDEESISGEGLSFSVDSVAGATGSFDGGYTLGTPTQDNVLWISDTQYDSGSVEFTKTVYLDEPRITTGEIADVAILTGSDGFTDSVPIDVSITTDAKADLTIIKTIPDVLEEGETASFTFEILKLDDLSLIDSVTINIQYGELSKSETLSGLVPDKYLVKEVSSSPSGWTTLPPQEVDITLPQCCGEVTFHNQTFPARAKAKKITIPGGYEEGWEFTLYRMTQGGLEFIEKGETNSSGMLIFAALLEDGTYKIVETQKEAWDPENGTECTFDVDLPEDAGKFFDCSFKNRFESSIEFKKTGDELSKVGDFVDYKLTLKNTSPAGGPDLYCTITDEMLDIEESVTLTSGQTHEITASYEVQDGDPDPLKNTAKVCCIQSQPGTQFVECVEDCLLEASSTWSVNLFKPSISFEKTGDSLSKSGDIVDYVITLKNTSSNDTPNLDCIIIDTMLGTNESVELAPGQIHKITPSYTVQDDDQDPLMNEACVYCSPVGFPNVLEACDWHSVELFKPSIMLTKSGDNYSKVGDTVTYMIKIKNTSSSNTPNLSLVAFNDSLVPGVTPPPECSDLGPGEYCEFSYDYIVQQKDDSGEVGATLKNTATASYQVDGFPNKVSDTSNQWSVELLHPDYTVSKECPDYPIHQEGPAIFTVIFQNTGDVDLTVIADEDLKYNGGIISAGTPFTLPVGMTKEFNVIIDGPFSGQETVTNLINSEATLPEWTGLDNVLKRSDKDTCILEGKVNVLKLTNGVVDPEIEWNFTLTGPGLPEEGVHDTTLGDLDGILDFENADLNPAGKYTICETGLPAAWISEWKVDTNGDGTADKIITPYNPDQPEDLGTRCFDFGAGTSYPIPQGGTLVFEINNIFPGGAPRTPGYWKNWNTCSKGNQQYTAAANGGPEAGWYLLDDLLEDPGISWGDFIIATCEEGVSILDKRDSITGKKMANDGAYKLACNLLAAQLNFAAGAKTCKEAVDAATEAEDLLISLGFNGTGNYLSSKDSDYHTAVDLAETLDEYNNGILCNPPPATSSKESTSRSSSRTFSTLMGLNLGYGLIPSTGIAMNLPVGINTPFSSPLGLGNAFSGAYAMNTGFSPTFGLAVGQNTGFSSPLGFGNAFSGAFGMNTGFSPTFGLAVGQSTSFNPPFGTGTGISPPLGLAVGQSAGFSPPFGVGNAFSAPFGLAIGQSAGFSPPFGMAIGQSAGFSPPFGIGNAFSSTFGMSTGFSPTFGYNMTLQGLY